MKTSALLFSAIAALSTLSDAAWTAPYKLTLYHTSWSQYGRNYQVKDIPIDYVSEIAYAFFNVLQDGSVVTGDSWADFDKRFTGADSVAPPDSWNTNDGTYGNFGQFMKLKQSGKSFTFTLAVGGWTWSKYFSPAMSNAITRAKFSSDLIGYMKKYNFIQGISIDWEYLSNDNVNYGNTGNMVNSADVNNFILFLQQFRKDLNANGLTNAKIQFCASAATDKIKWDIPTLAPLIDELHVMTYDFSDGNWGDKVASHHTNLYKTSYTPYSIDTAVTYYLKQGFPAKKIMIGAAYYSRGFANTDGIGQAASGGSLDMSWEQGIADYKSLPRTGATEFWDPAAQAGYSYDSTRRVLNSYDTVDSVKAKCNYVKSKGLLGIIVWESSGDYTDVKNARSLTKAMYDCFHSTTTPTPAPAPAPAPAPVPAPAPPTAPPSTKPPSTSAPAPVPAPPKASPVVSSTLPVAAPKPPKISKACDASTYDYHICTGGHHNQEFGICQQGRGWIYRACPAKMICATVPNQPKKVNCIMP